ncbi:PspC domain-containing protein [Massilia horti]|uniref:PspC domain-containing protein n=1 Tax=Massilia horti TaxID=2562153 RepID=A0A4Y9SPT5_9BURK|nr:PspC domain-containing protein [Massilia horti]TFW28568.1 PspC domain-containing protein [Massilia horti]
MTMSDELKRLHDLHQAGALTDAEYETAKARVLAGSSANPSPGTTTDFSAQVNALRRSRTDRWLGGVCGGLAKATAVDSWVWRLMFVLFTLTFGFGVVLYLLLWIFVPEE